MTLMVRCCLCGSVHDFDDPEDNTILLMGRNMERLPVCFECTAEIVHRELERRGLE